jgi:hypothetical protein
MVGDIDKRALVNQKATKMHSNKIGTSFIRNKPRIAPAKLSSLILRMLGQTLMSPNIEQSEVSA